MIIKEIVLAIEPALRKLEDILYWKDRLKTVGVLVICHFLFWLFQTYNIRTYFTISAICLGFHLLDAYRTKKRREIIRQQHKQASNLSSIGRYILIIHMNSVRLWDQLVRLKQKNRIRYILLSFVFWSATAVIGIKIRGFYLSYFMFWVIFLIPAIIHYEIPKKLLNKALPFLEQLDQSMKYERRSILNKDDLLVDVMLPPTQIDDEEEDEYIKSLTESDNLKEKYMKAFENVDEEDEINDDDEEEDDNDGDHNGEDLSSSESYDNEPRQSKPNPKSRSKSFLFSQIDDDEINSSLLPVDEMPSVLSDDSHLQSFLPDIDSLNGNRAVRPRRVKNRPSIFNYYAPEISKDINQQDIDETFDFLDEELKKYKK